MIFFRYENFSSVIHCLLFPGWNYKKNQHNDSGYNHLIECNYNILFMFNTDILIKKAKLFILLIKYNLYIILIRMHIECNYLWENYKTEINICIFLYKFIY